MTRLSIDTRGQRDALPLATPRAGAAAPQGTTREPSGLTPAEIRQIVLDIIG